MRDRILTHAQISFAIIISTIIFTSLIALGIHSIERKKKLEAIEGRYRNAIDYFSSNLNTIKDYHRNHQAILLFDNKASAIIRSLFSQANLKEKTYPFVMDSKGRLLVHPYSEGANVSQTFWGATIMNAKTQAGHFSFFSEEYQIKNKLFWVKNPHFDVYIGIVGEYDIIYGEYHSSQKILASACILLIFLISLMSIFVSRSLLTPNSVLYKNLAKLSLGQWGARMSLGGSKDVCLISQSFDNLAGMLERADSYSKAIAEGAKYQLGSKNIPANTLFDNLAKIEANILESADIEAKRKIEDEKLSWFNTGMAKFGEVLRLSTSSTEELADNVIQSIVKYVKANQGGFFASAKDENGQEHLELISAFAFDTKKFTQKRIELGEGLVGTCAVEKQTIYIEQTPEHYIEITSGLGDAPPRSILIVPIKLEEAVLGVIEIASFSFFEDYQIKFIEKIMESVASTLASSKINQQTKELLRKFELQSKEMTEQEEEMRQNIEELTATQEEATNKEAELQSVIQALASTVNFIEFDPEFRILNLNENFANLFDLQYEATFGKSLNDLILLGRAKFDNTSDALKTMQAGSELVYTGEYSVNGVSINIKDSYLPIKNIHGVLVKIIRVATVIN
jgi:methyl-accepting chemotaxis protein